MSIRNSIVGLFGLKAARREESSALSVGIFPIVACREDQVILGFDDLHLDFRIVVDVVDIGATGVKIVLTTLVERHNLLGRAYIFVITPFHRLIVRTLLRRYVVRSAVNG